MDDKLQKYDGIDESGNKIEVVRRFIDKDL